jgi:hypothetical protein
MPQIEISNEVDAKLKAFRKIFDIIAETKPGANLNYGELILSIGIDSLFHDVFPADNPLLQETMVKMFQKNPHFVAEFTADTLQAGTPRKVLKDKWSVNQHIQ